MSLPTEAQARAILDSALAAVPAGAEGTASLTGANDGNLRFARNAVSTSGEVANAELAIEVAFGRRGGATTTNRLDPGGIADAVRRAAELARLAPENPESLPPIEPQRYRSSPTWNERTAAITPAQRADAAAAAITPCREADLVAAGFLSDTRGIAAIANSRGNFGYQRQTGLDFTCTVRTPDGQGSGWVGRNLADVARFAPGEDAQRAIRRARDSVGARALEPGKYDVILEPHALAPLMLWFASGFLGNLDARSADEGRSVFARKGGGNRIGDRLFDPRLTLRTDPHDARVPTLPWDEEGVARQPCTIIRDGTLEALEYSRHWARRKDRAPTGRFGNLIVDGSERDTAELVRGMRKGILVTRLYYVNIVDPQTMLLTGLTRDGTFYVENGRIKHPVRNFRFVESVVVMFNNIEAIGRPERVASMELPTQSMLLPALHVRDFTFTSLSDAV